MDMKVLRDAGACHYDIPLVIDLNWTQLEDRLPVGSSLFLAESLPSSVSRDERSIVDYTQPNYAECQVLDSQVSVILATYVTAFLRH